MAALDFNEFVGQIRSRLGLHEAMGAQIGRQLKGIELTDEEGVRLADVVNLELSRIYAERHIADTIHRVPHDVVETPETNDHWEKHGGKWANKPVHEIRRTNALSYCPDCHRSLEAAANSPIPLLVCSRLHGLMVSGLADLTPNDIIACGVTV